jgi:urease subunit gamma
LRSSSSSRGAFSGLKRCSKGHRGAAAWTLRGGLHTLTVEAGMHLTPREIDKLLILSMAEIARRRRANGLRLNHPEAVAVITAAALEAAREGRSVEETMKIAAKVLSRNDVMEGVAEMIPMVQVEAVFTDGSRLVTVHSPIQ